MRPRGWQPPLIAHIVHRFDYGGLENGLVNLINHLPENEFRHAVISLTEIGDIAGRIRRQDCELFALRREPGPLLLETPRLFRLLRRLAPAIVHTRNVGTIETQVAAALARIPSRIHGEHGWEVHDLGHGHHGLLRTRRLMRHLIHEQVALSGPTEAYLREKVGVPQIRLHSIYNGVDTDRFAPSVSGRRSLPDGPAWPLDSIVIGTVGRQQDVKNPMLLLQAFLSIREHLPTLAPRLKLVMVGDGPLLPQLRDAVNRSGATQSVWIPGALQNVERVYPGLDAFVIPSLAEGLCNTILEAMACGVPVIATEVGGNAELVENERTGLIVRSGSVEGMKEAIVRYALDPEMRRQHAVAARARVLAHFSLSRMVGAYAALYHQGLGTG